VMVSSGENQWGLWDGSMTYSSTLPPILFFEVVILVYGKVTKQSIAELHMLFVEHGWYSHCFCSWGSNFCPSIGLIGTDCDRTRILSGDLSVLSHTCIYGGVGNCLVV
jgi:hypothetical protein